MKVSKEILILALPLLAAGCGGSSTGTSPPPPPAGVDPEGIYLGPAGATDTMLGIVTADGTANFLQFTGSLSQTAPFVILAPRPLITDSNGNYSVTYDGYSGNGYSLPSGSIDETGTLTGLAVPGTSLAGSYSVTGPIQTAIAVNPQTATSINYNLQYQASAYETSASSTKIAGTYSVTLVVGTTVLTGGVFSIEAGTTTQASFSNGTDGATSCLYSGTITVPDPNRNAYKFSIQSSGPGCQLSFDNLEGLGTLTTLNSQSALLSILSDTATSQGVLLILSPPV